MAKKNAQPHEKVPISAITDALSAFGGDYKLAAAHLNKEYPTKVTEAYIRDRIKDSPQLKAIYNTGKGMSYVPDEVETATRNGKGMSTTEIIASNPMMPDEVHAQDMVLLSKGLKAAGMKDSTIEMLETLGKFELSGGRLMCTTLEILNRMQVMSALQLFESIQDINRKIIECQEGINEENRDVKNAEYAHWIRLRNQCYDILQKSQDRSVLGMQALVKIQSAINSKRNGGRSNAKPGPSPINRAPKTK